MMSLSLVAFGAQAVVCVGDTVVEEGPLVSAKPLVRLTSKAVRASGRALWERSECSRVECADGRWVPGGQGAGPNVTRGELR